MHHNLFISTSELNYLLNSHSVQVIDAGMNHQSDYEAHHIPGAIFFNVSEIRSQSSRLSQEVPSLAEFAFYLQQLGIKETQTLIVIYDQSNPAPSGRAWFLFNHFGVKNVRVLNGGFSKWTSENRPTESGMRKIPIVNNPRYNLSERQNDRVFFNDVLRTSQEIRAGQSSTRIWDPRPSEMYLQESVDSSVNMPATLCFNGDKTVKSQNEVAELIRRYVGGERIITSCMKGNTACLAYMLLKYIDYENSAAYTGSLEEWKLLKPN